MWDLRWLGPLLGAAVSLGGCTHGHPSEARPLRVLRVVPDRQKAETLLLLNQDLIAYFNRRIDPLTVTRDTFRVTDEHGRVTTGTLQVGTRSITFVPRPPLHPTLDDGSYRPGEVYHLEISGFPRADSIRSIDGSVLERTVLRRYKAVSADTRGSDYPSPLWPVGRDRPFEVRQGMLKMATQSASLRLHFSRPVLPSSVHLDSVELYRLRAGEKSAERVYPVAIGVMTSPPPVDPFPGSTVELTFDSNIVGPDDLLYLLLARGDRAIVDYGGEKVHVTPPVPVPIHPGQRAPLLEVSFRKPIVLAPTRLGMLGFVAVRGRVMPRARVSAGTGRLGNFEPRHDVVLASGRVFDSGDGRRLSPSGASFDFLDIEIPRGVTVVLRGLPGEKVRLRAAGRISISGSLIIDAADYGPTQVTGDQVELADLTTKSRVMLIAGGDIEIKGRLGTKRQVGRGESPVTLLAGGDVTVDVNGLLPPGTILATDSGGAVRTAAADIIRLEVPMQAGVPDGAVLHGEAWTGWYRPARHVGPVSARWLGRQGKLSVWIQVAPPHPGHPDRPYLGAPRAPLPLPARDLTVPPGGFVRFLLRAELRVGAPPPSLSGLVVSGG